VPTYRSGEAAALWRRLSFRHAAGGRPVASLKARLKAASEP
jgi:hypothetical protein